MSVSSRRLAELIGPLEGPGPVYRQLSDQLRVLIVDGRLAHGARLPSERELAEALGVSRTTTTRSYAQLREDQLAQARQGAGTVVFVPRQESLTSSLMATPDDADTIALTYSAPTGPPGLSKAFARAIDRLPTLLGTTGYLPDGLPELRELIAQSYRDRGLPTDPTQIIITNGSMGAISLAIGTMLRPGDRVAVEAFSYPHAYDSITQSGGRLSALPVADRPWDTDDLDRLLAAGTHRSAYLVPEFHNPSAAVMTDDERGSIARSFRRHGVQPVIDDSLHAVNLDGVALPPPFAAYCPDALLVGSSSKPYWGGLRVGWIRAPHAMVTPLVQARMAVDLGTSAFDQLVLAELLSDGGQTAAAGRARLRTARDHLLDRLGEELPEIDAPCPAGGLNVWAQLPEPVSTRMAAAASRHGLMITPGPRFYARPGRAGEYRLRLPYTGSPEQLTEAVRRLRTLFDDVLERGIQGGDACPDITLIA